MSGIAGAFVLPSSHSQGTVYDRLKHMVPKLENRGQVGFGLAAFMHANGTRYMRSGRPPRELMTLDCDGQDANFRPHVAIAHIRSPSSKENGGSLAQPVDNQKAGCHQLVLSSNGALANTDELRKELIAQGHSFDGTMDAELLLKLVENICQEAYWQHDLQVNYENVFRALDGRIDGAVSALLLDGEGNLIAFRNSSGLRPLEFMQTEDGFILFASENSAFAGLQGKTEEISPGHIRYVDGKTGECFQSFVGHARHSPKLCVYETLYIGNLETSIQGQSHLATRHKIGVTLGETISQRVEAEMGYVPVVVSSMPHTGGPYADGLFASLTEKYSASVERREVIATKLQQRTLIGVLGTRKSVIAQKYCVEAESNVRDKAIIMVDEALIRGDTSRAVTQMLHAAGAKAVHWAIGSPPVVAPNYYGMGIETIDELAFWRIWKTLPPDKRLESLCFHKMGPQTLRVIESKIAVSINAASVTFLPFHALKPLLPGGSDGIDLSPFTFEMPTPEGEKRANENLNRLITNFAFTQPTEVTS
jgi:glutamine phosphoribosylpyrophosphate amidotransferase